MTSNTVISDATALEKRSWITLFFCGLATTIGGLVLLWLRATPSVGLMVMAGCLCFPLLFRWLTHHLTVLGAIAVLGVTFMTGFLGSFVNEVDWVGPLYTNLRWLAPLLLFGFGLLRIGFSAHIWHTLLTSWGSVSLPLLLFLAYALLSTLYSSAPVTTLGRAGTFAAISLGTGAALWPIIQHRNQAERLLSYIALLMAVLILPGEIYLFSSSSIGWHTSGRFRSTFWNPVTFAHLCTLLLPLYLWLMVKAQAPTWQRLGAGIMSVILLINLYFAYSRSSALALIVIMPLLAWHFVTPRIRFVLTALLLLGSTLAIAFQAEEIRHFFTRGADWTNNYQFYSGRLTDWQQALELWSQSPIVGYGFGSIGNDDAVLTSQQQPWIASRVSATAGLRLSNLYLETLGSGGAIGTLLLLFLLYRLFRALSRGQNPMLPVETQLFAILGLTTFWGGLVLNLTETWLVSAGSPYAMYWWLVLFLVVRVNSGQQVVRRSPAANGQRETPRVWGHVALGDEAWRGR